MGHYLSLCRFQAKESEVSDGVSGLNPLHFTALPRKGGEDALLCPVQALQLYLDRVASHRKGHKNVFSSNQTRNRQNTNCTLPIIRIDKVY